MRRVSLRKVCEYQLYALAFALPFEFYIHGRERSLLTTLKLQILVLFVTWTATKLIETRARPETARNRIMGLLPDRFLPAVTALILVQSLSAALAPAFRGNAIEAAAKMMLGAFFALLVGDVVLGSRPQDDRSDNPAMSTLLALSVSGTCVALLGLGELAGIGFFARIAHVFQPSKFNLGQHLRLVSTMEYPNTAGSFLSVALCATLALTSFSGTVRERKWSIASVAVVGIQGIALAFTYSRGAIVSTIIAVAVASAMSKSWIRGAQGRIAQASCLAVLLGGALAAYYVHRASEHTPRTQQRIARFGLQGAEEVMSLHPALTYGETIAVQNDSCCTWRKGTYGVGYRWHNLSSNENSSPQIGTDFTSDLAPSELARVQVALRTPPQAGEYFLIWFVFQRSDQVREVKDSYSPGILCIIHPAGTDAGRAITDKARRYLGAIREERRSLNGAQVPTRGELWSVAIRMFRQRPILGMGPDNFRLLKWKYMEVPQGDETILANSTYLDLLSGSGILGIAAFAWLMWEFGRGVARRLSPGASHSDWILGYFGTAYLTGFLSHGLVDYFLKFTPTFLLFWLVVGIVCLGGRASAENVCADRL
ncbi:MAG TPA: O-antigen ligase family protein [Acidobacteriota bacterium]|nr:O-antigen ligase family protein [Acidobacteriota bacterium]